MQWLIARVFLSVARMERAKRKSVAGLIDQVRQVPFGQPDHYAAHGARGAVAQKVDKASAECGQFDAAMSGLRNGSSATAHRVATRSAVRQAKADA